MKKTVFLLLAAGALASCSSDGSDNPWKGKMQPIPVSEDVTMSRAEADAADCINAFASDLFHASAKMYDETFEKKDGNMCVSPFSAAMALAMVANAGNEAVAADITGMLGCADLELLNSTSNKLMRKVPSAKDCSVDLANSVWVNTAYTPVPELVKSLNSVYYAEVESFDAANPQQCLDMINGWVMAKTNNHIKNLVSEISAQHVAFFINALYFNALWDNEFSEDRTVDAVFNGTAGRQSVKMMRQMCSETYGYGELENASYMAKSFKGKKTMWFVLPDEGVSIDELSETFDFASVYDLDTRVLANVDFGLPKFDIGCSMTLDEVLKALGVNIASCYFPKLGVFDECTIKTIQKTTIKVDEKGTEMAAATDVEIMITSPGPGMERPKDVRFVLDRPFLFFVTDQPTGAVLMAGRICNL